MCHDDSMDLQFSIETGKKDVERAKATIADEEAKIGAAEAKIEELSTTIATGEKDLASATEIREKEKADFDKLEKELMEAVSMLERAYGIIESKASKESMDKVMDALEAVIVSAGVNSGDKAKVQALLQATQGSSDADLEFQPAGAPDPAAYKSQSGGILSVLEDMLEKAKAELASAQKAEMNEAFDFKMLKQKIEDAVAFGEKTLAETKEAKATAEGELETAAKNLADDETHLKDLQQECMTAAEEDTESKKSRAEELEALATAKKILEEKTGAASDRAYSFIQIGTVSKAGTSTKAKQVKQEILDLLQGLAEKNGDKQMSLLAQRVQTAAMLGEDPFAKIKGLISEMIEKLEAEAAKEAAHKAFCDKEMSETKAKKEDKETELDDLSTKIDKATSKIAKLKEEVATLETELGEIAAAQKKADELRMEQKEAWTAAKADYEQSLEGVGMALQVLRDYYAEKDAFIQGGDSAFLQGRMNAAKHSKATGASTGIIGMLEVVESDFSKLLAEGNAAEAMAQEEYEKLTQDNEIATTEKETAVKYKVKDSKETESMLAGLKEDKEIATKEYDAIMEYWEKLQPMCIAKPEPYAERKRRREAEIAGLKQALTILEEEAGSPAFLQTRTARRA